VGGGHRVHIIDLAAGGPLAMKLPAIPGRHTLFTIAIGTLQWMISDAINRVRPVPGPAEWFNHRDGILNRGGIRTYICWWPVIFKISTIPPGPLEITTGR
jgi:hypothetical protein